MIIKLSSSLSVLTVLSLQNAGTGEPHLKSNVIQKNIQISPIVSVENTNAIRNYKEELKLLLADEFDKEANQFHLKKSGSRKCTFSYAIDSDSHVQDVKLIQSSNFVEFDDAVSATIKNIKLTNGQFPASTGTIEFSCDLGTQVDHRPTSQDAARITRSYHSDDLSSEASRSMFRSKRGTYRSISPFYN